jgi:hypothetical protein
MVFRVYCIYFVTEDIFNPRNEDEALYYVALAGIVSLVIKILIPITKLVRYRKYSIVYAAISFGIVMIANGTLQFYGK